MATPNAQEIARESYKNDEPKLPAYDLTCEKSEYIKKTSEDKQMCVYILS